MSLNKSFHDWDADYEAPNSSKVDKKENPGCLDLESIGCLFVFVIVCVLVSYT